ncbi:MAG: hypothetical protein ABIJ03_03790 [Patescibacteria group bacterium]|nr:hypothetical protein [Patescibacteria group bacterium]
MFTLPTVHEHYHGLVLALISYLSGNRRLIVPMPGKPNGGRPIKAGYRLYGKKAGITNYWPEVKKLDKNLISLTNLR